MRICVHADPAKLSPAMGRIAEALIEYRPDGWEATPKPELADLVVLHCVGYPDTAEAIDNLRAAGKKYAMIQYCLRTTQQPDATGWLDLWRGAETVWSYYDLDAALVEDGYAEQTCPWCGEELPHVGQGTGATDYPRCFYFAPLGVDSKTFYPRITSGDRYACVTSGYLDGPEAIAEPTAAAEILDRATFHLGPRLNCLGPNATVGYGCGDNQLATAYSRSDFVTGMRRVEGFEMPAAEGLLCGARPVMFDRPHYRTWFEPWAIFVKEDQGPLALTEQLAEIFRTPQPVTEEERAAAAARFDWPTICRGFYSRATGEKQQ